MQLLIKQSQSLARLAGFIYLTVVITGMFGLVYVPSQLIVSTDPSLTFNNLTKSTGLFRLGIASNILCYLAFLILPLVIYKVLSHVQKEAAVLMVVFAVVSVPISLYNLSHKLDILNVVENTALVSANVPQPILDRVMQRLDEYDTGMLLSKIFWGLWLLPLGYLVIRSRQLPWVLGLFLILGCFGYLISTFGEILIPGFNGFSLSRYVTLPAAFGEIGLCLWLVIFGIKTRTHETK